MLNVGNSSGGVGIDLHTKTVFEVRTTLADQLYACHCLGRAEITIIHGYTSREDISNIFGTNGMRILLEARRMLESHLERSRRIRDVQWLVSWRKKRSSNWRKVDPVTYDVSHA